MFTGIIETTGQIIRQDMLDQDMRMAVRSNSFDFSDVKLGDSIAVNGVCLTVIELHKNQFSVDVSKESLQCTTLASLELDVKVNLEKALRLQDRLGGHLVSGHVDGLGTIKNIQAQGRSTQVDCEIPAELAKYVAPKGSICVDGISLTVNEITANVFSVNIVPHTMTCTNLDNIAMGDRVNIEVDMIARYLEKLALLDHKPLNIERLASYGFSHE